MAETTHDIDPDGDTILVLQNANAPFAVWDPNDEWPDALAPKKAGIEETSNDNLEQEASSDAPSSPFLEEQNQPKIRLRVSSRHLALASEYFKKMLSGPWKESNVHPGSEYVVSAADWDLEALLILMNIIHGHVRKVPRDLDVEMFAKIAVLVDYYQCHEVVELFVERWLQNLTTPSEWTYNRDLILRLFIALTFPDDATFTSMTAIALSSARGPLHTLNLPIPTGVLDRFEETRQRHIGAHFSTIFKTFSMLSESKTGCYYECNSMLLGSLVMRLQSHRIFPQQPTYPFIGYSFKTTQDLIWDVREPLWYNYDETKSRNHNSRTVQRHRCSLAELLRESASQRPDMIGLRLHDCISTQE